MHAGALLISTHTSNPSDHPLYQVGDAILPKRILVTGTAGFIGFHAAAALRLQGHGVVGLDNFNPYYSVRLKRARAQLLDQQGVHTVQADLNDQEAVAEVLRLCECTHVLHLAAQAGVRYAVKNPGAYVHSNVAGFVALMEAVRKVTPQPPAVVYASSSSVYGLNERVPFSEDDAADRPSSVYAATKKADELLAHTYAHLHGLSLTGLRFFTVYGPWGRPDMAAFAFARAILDGSPVRVFTRTADGDDGGAKKEMWRDFTYVDDIVAGTMRALETAERSRPAGEAWGGGGGGGGGGPPARLYNLGNTHPVNVSTFLSILERHLNRKASRQYVPAPATGDVMRTHADVSRASRDLGYSPRVSLDEGLARFAQWYTSYYGRGQFPEDGDGDAFSRRRGLLAWGADGEVGVEGLDVDGGDPFEDGEGHPVRPPGHGDAAGGA